jgi:GntR family transcriptional regulator, transcriptional repressor for pyruvate dehydrogenase complex
MMTGRRSSKDFVAEPDAVRTGTRVSQVVREMTGDILTLRRPGDKLPPVDDLATQFNVSRTVIREAIGVVAAKGLVRVRHGDGTYVRELSVSDLSEALSNLVHFRARDNRTLLIDLMELRIVLETYSAQLAAERATPQDIGAIGAAIERGRDSHKAKDRTAVVDADIDFHAALAVASHNSLLALILEVIAPMLYDLREHLVAQPTLSAASLKDHERIFSAVVQRDPQAAAEAARSHTENLRGELYRKLFGVAPAPSRP